jgi:hypothetical protein
MHQRFGKVCICFVAFEYESTNLRELRPDSTRNPLPYPNRNPLHILLRKAKARLSVQEPCPQMRRRTRYGMEGSARQSIRGAKLTRGHGRRRDAVRARKKKIPGAPLGAALAQHPLVEQCAEGCSGQCEQLRRSAADVVCGAGSRSCARPASRSCTGPRVAWNACVGASAPQQYFRGDSYASDVCVVRRISRSPPLSRGSRPLW